MNTVASITAPSRYDASLDTLSRIPQQQLDQDDFLQLLVAQMTTQDPLKPKEDFDFISQMASFTSLEQTRSMLKDLSVLRSDQELMKANALIGRAVEVEIDAETRAIGVVSAVEVEAGKPRVVVDGARYDLNQLRAIKAPALPA